MLFKLVWKNLIRRPLQSGLTFFIVAACIAALVGSVLTLWSIENGAQGVLDQWGADVLVLPVQAEYSPEEILFTGTPANIYMDVRVLNEVRQISGVEAATPQFFTQTLNQSCCSLPKEYRFVGYDPQSDFLVNNLLAQGVGRDLNSGEVIVGGDIPAFLGDRVAILSQPFDVAGYLKTMGGSIDKTIFAPIDTARSVAAQSPYLQENWKNAGDPQKLISSVLIRTNPEVSPEEVAREISRIPGVKTVTAGKVMQDLKEQLAAFRAVIWTLILIICAITVASLCTRYSSLVLEKREEVGLLRILGAERRQIFIVVLTEALFSVLVASVAGSFLGLGLLFYFKKMLEAYSSFPFLLPNWPQVILAILGIVLATIALSFLAALWPARRSAHMDPILALAEGQLR